MSEKGVQHGYLPGLGVLTAWEALTKLLDRPNLFEADFKGFFDNVTHSGIEVILKQMGYPDTEVDFISSLNRSIVKLPERVRIKETRVDLMGQFDISRQDEWTDEEWAYATSFLDAYMETLDDPLAPEIYDNNKKIGVPQGAPTSCSVATLCLRDIEKRLKAVLYADDGVYSPETSNDSEIGKVEDPEKGVKLNPNK